MQNVKIWRREEGSELNAVWMLNIYSGRPVNTKMYL